MRINKIIVAFNLICMLLMPIAGTLAATEIPGPADRLNNIADNAGYNIETDDATSLAETIGLIVNLFLGMLGIIFVVLMVYAGYNWMTAMGDEKKVDKAKDTIKSSIIGLILIISAYALWAFIDTYLLSSTS